MMKKKHLYATVILLTFLAAGIKPSLAAINIPSDTSVGTWDENNLLYTLTTDVSDTIILSNPYWDGDSDHTPSDEDSRLTFDGGGYTVDLGTLDFGIAFGEKRAYITIQNVNITDCGNGIDINTATRINVINNDISYCQYGISIGIAGTCIIRDNTISDCSEYGIWLSGAVNNAIYNNNFISNNNPAVVSGGSDNVFDLGESGNYWSDYTGADTNGDGIGETAYTFTGGQDDFPWVEQNGWTTPPPPPTPVEAIEDVIEVLENMAVPDDAEKEVGKAVKELNKAIKEFEKGKTDKAIKKITKAVNELEKAQNKGADTQGVIDELNDLVQGL